MKNTANGKVPDRVYYYMLDWKDSYLDNFVKLTGKSSIAELTTEELWKWFKFAVEVDKAESIPNQHKLESK